MNWYAGCLLEQEAKSSIIKERCEWTSPTFRFKYDSFPLSTNREISARLAVGNQRSAPFVPWHPISSPRIPIQSPNQWEIDGRMRSRTLSLPTEESKVYVEKESVGNASRRTYLVSHYSGTGQEYY